MLSRLVLLGLAGALGALCRYGIYRWLAVEAAGRFPFATLTVNCVGCFLFGLVYVLSEEFDVLTAAQRVIVLTGFLGAFTTFSTFAFETGTLIEQGAWLRAGTNVLAQNVGGLICVFAGVATARAIA